VGLHAGGVISLLLQKAASELGRSLTLRVQVTSFDVLCTMVSSGLGVGVFARAAGAALVQRKVSAILSAQA
jgi:DNA-binding transcriptional LysR family regulator